MLAWRPGCGRYWTSRWESGNCVAILKEFQPDVVVGVGGYASGPGMVAAILKRIPTVAFEPNAAPGLANRLVGKRVSAAAVSFAPACAYFRNAKVTGIPVRKEFFELQPRASHGAPCLLVFGGSQGARVFNTVMPRIAAALLEAVPGLTILHQAGARHAETTLAEYQSCGADPARWQVHAFLDDMPKRFAAANLVLPGAGPAPWQRFRGEQAGGPHSVPAGNRRPSAQKRRSHGRRQSGALVD